MWWFLPDIYHTGAFFLVPIFLIGGLSSIYGLEYWRQSRHPRTARNLRFWYALLIAGMALLVLCDNSICFLIAWELVALGSFFLIATEDQKPASRQAAWIYLVATHVSTLLGLYLPPPLLSLLNHAGAYLGMKR